MNFNKITLIFAILATITNSVFSMKRQLQKSYLLSLQTESKKQKDSEISEKLFEAIKNNKSEIISDFIRSGGNVNTRITIDCHPCFGFTLLHCAVMFDKSDIVKSLINKNAKINLTIKSPGNPFHGFTPLHLAVNNENPEITEKLLQSNADSDFPITNPTSKFHGISPLHLAVIYNNESLVNIILNYDPEIDAKVSNPNHEFNGHTALHIAVINNSLNIIRLLLSKNADPYSTIDNLGKPYHEFDVFNLLIFKSIKEKIEQEFYGVIKTTAGINIIFQNPDGTAVMTPIIQYLQHIQQTFQCPAICYLMASIHLQRLLNEKNPILTKFAFHQIFLAALVIAIKSIVDIPYSNAHYAKCCGLSLEYFNNLEGNTLNAMHFNISISPQDIDLFQKKLLEYFKS